MDNPYLTYDVNGVTYQVVADIEKKQMRINREYIPEDDFMSCQAVIIPTKEYCTFATKTPEGISMFNAQYNCSATTKLKRFSMRDRNILSVVTPENNLLIASLDKKTKELSFYWYDGYRASLLCQVVPRNRNFVMRLETFTFDTEKTKKK